MMTKIAVTGGFPHLDVEAKWSVVIAYGVVPSPTAPPLKSPAWISGQLGDRVRVRTNANPSQCLRYQTVNPLGFTTALEQMD